MSYDQDYVCGETCLYGVDVLHDRVGVVKIKDMISQSCLRWCGHTMHEDTNS